MGEEGSRGLGQKLWRSSGCRGGGEESRPTTGLAVENKGKGTKDG